MPNTDPFEPQLSPADLRLLGHLHQKWPTSTTVTPFTVSLSPTDDGRAAFVSMMQTLSDNGLISYEAFLMQPSLGLRFIGTMITARGKAALRSATVHA
jgi:hypothetical protein